MKQILLLEDDIMIASGLVYALSNEGYEVVHCSTVCEALDNVKNREFSLAILDMQLPDGTGFDVSMNLKKTGTPVIFLTIVDDEANIVRAFEDGADDYVVKPFRIRELLARVKRTLHKQEGMNQESLTIEVIMANDRGAAGEKKELWLKQPCSFCIAL